MMFTGGLVNHGFTNSASKMLDTLPVHLKVMSDLFLLLDFPLKPKHMAWLEMSSCQGCYQTHMVPSI